MIATRFKIILYYLPCCRPEDVFKKLELTTFDQGSTIWEHGVLIPSCFLRYHDYPLFVDNTGACGATSHVGAAVYRLHAIITISYTSF